MPTVRAVEPFAYPVEGGHLVSVTAGELFDSSDPCVKKRPSLFEPVEVTVASRKAATATAVVTETASASPGEHRARTHTPPKTAAIKTAAPKPEPVKPSTTVAKDTTK